jgi:hypothetical protein
MRIPFLENGRSGSALPERERRARFKPGDKVRYGEQVMVVDTLQKGVDIRDIIWCVWFENGERKRSPFATATLDTVDQF